MGLALATLCLGVGMILIFARGEVASVEVVQVVRPSALLAQLAAGAPRAWLTLGVLALIATPSLRVTALLGWCHFENKRVALAAGALVLCLLLGALGGATYLAETAA
ncbi:MAG: DUF1634 domain-containing protein [Planctomycetes bacterium]|nr:DUF1634 domain-containing protein [Planctomycetota bacterium]